MGQEAHGLGRLQPRIPHTHRPVPLAQSVPVGAHPKWGVRHLRWLRIAHRSMQKPLKRLTVLQIPAAHNVRHSLIQIVHHYGQLIGPGAVGAAQDHRVVKPRPPRVGQLIPKLGDGARTLRKFFRNP